jgi:hypothetical protein
MAAFSAFNTIGPFYAGQVFFAIIIIIGFDPIRKL